MNAKPFFDTNILIYAFHEDDPRKEIARILLAMGGVIGVQTLNEFVAVARRNSARSWEQISEALAAIQILCPSPVPLTLKTHEAAVRIAQRYQYHIYDSLIIAAALDGRCSTLYSEDMHDGQVIDGLTIRNPFTKSPDC
jgi:predicted nucleic acid-binding protein